VSGRGLPSNFGVFLGTGETDEHGGGWFAPKVNGHDERSPGALVVGPFDNALGDLARGDPTRNLRFKIWISSVG